MRKFLYTCLLVSQAAFGKTSTLESHHIENFKGYIGSYMSLYEMSPSCFFAYNKKKPNSFPSLYFTVKDDLCSDAMGTVCKKRFMSFNKDYETAVFDTFRKNIMTESACHVSPKMKKAFKDFSNRVVKARESFYSKTFSLVQMHENGHEFMKAFAELYKEEMSQLHNLFPKDYMDQIISGEERIVLLPSLIKLAAGNYFDLDPADVLRAIESEKKKIRNQFAQSFLKKAKDPSVEALPYYSLDAFYNSSEILGSFDFDDTFTFNLLKKYSSEDPKVTGLLLNRRYQRAVWLLNESGQESLSEALESFIRKNLLKDDAIQGTKNLGLGFTDTFLMTYDNNARVIYKPKISFFENPIKAISSHPKKETAAYVIDKMLKINAVPMTFIYEHKEMGKGSSQYFILDSYRARDVKEFYGEKPRKFTEPTGRIAKDHNMLLFDWLTDNKDRNADNYMLLDTGKVVYIDHSLSFMEVSRTRKISCEAVKAMMPTKRVYQQLKYLSTHKDLMQAKLGPYLSKKQIKVFVSKIQTFVRTAEKMRKQGIKLEYAQEPVGY